MFSNLIIGGDSFSSGYGLENPTNAWPNLLARKLNVNLINFSSEGMGNENIISSIINHNDFKNTLVICALTHFSRCEFFNVKIKKRFTTIPNRRNQTNFENIFWSDFYDDEYYYNKFILQLKMFIAWLQINNINYFIFDALPINHKQKLDFKNYLWNGNKNMCDIIYPHQLSDGHPNEIGHKIMCDELYKIIKKNE